MVRKTWLLATILLAGCFETTPSVDAGGVDAGPPPPPPNDLDVLIQMDDSNSVTEEQWRFLSNLPRFVTAVMTGDVDGDRTPDAEPFDSLRVGVVTSDMGTGGFPVPTCEGSRFGRDGVLSTTGHTQIMGCTDSYPSFLEYSAATSLDDYVRDLGCVGTVGTGGCGFEQPLEATLKALTPRAATAGTAPGFEPMRFFDETGGHGDGLNAGFLRDDSTLVILMMVVEDDCAAADPDLYNIDSTRYSDDLNLRCHLHGDEALHPVSRYVDGFLQLRRYPNHLVFVPIGGIPADLATVPGEPTRWGPLTSDDPAIRDDRMEQRIEPSMPTRFTPSCNEPGTGLAFAPHRILSTAEGLERAGASVAVGSVCTEDQHQGFEALFRLLRP